MKYRVPQCVSLFSLKTTFSLSKSKNIVAKSQIYNILSRFVAKRYKQIVQQIYVGFKFHESPTDCDNLVCVCVFGIWWHVWHSQVDAPSGETSASCHIGLFHLSQYYQDHYQ